MAANFWTSSHCQVWLKETDDKWQPGEVIKVKEENLQESEEDRKRVAERNKKNAEIFSPETMEEDIKRLRVHLALYITELGRAKGVLVRQRVISTAIVYLARFYYYNSYKDFHPHLIGATALYLASKVEEHPVTPKAIALAGSQVIAGNQGGHTMPVCGSAGRPPNRCAFTGADIVEAEYFLMEDLKFNLLVFHAYRPMERLIKDAKDSNHGINVMVQDACLHFHENHKLQIKQVQQMMLELYDECNDLDKLDIEPIMGKIPRHDLGGPSAGLS